MRFWTITCFLTVCLLGTFASAAGAAVCPIGLTSGSSIADAAIDGTLGAEWGDANFIDSSAPCVSTLLDWDGVATAPDGHAAPALSKTVEIRSKRDANHLYLAFDVRDQTQNLTGGGPLPLGERLILQFDPDGSGGGALSNGAAASAKDYRLVLIHKWAPNLESMTFFDSTTAAGDSICGVQDWSVAAMPAGLEVGYGVQPGGYVFEVKIPTAALGLGAITPATNDMGLAFAVVNDLGNCVGGIDCDATGIAFPDTLPLTNLMNPLVLDPIDPTGCGDWLVPSNWATGFFNEVPGDVWISRDPRFWTSEDVDGLACGNINNNYYPTNPCRLAVRGCLRNSTGVDQTRNVLYLQGEHGAGVVNWKVVDLAEGVTIPPGDTDGTKTCFDSGEADSADVLGLTGHPCLRVYILPPSFDSDFDRNEILAINDASDLTTMVDTYGLGTQHVAQQNISRQAEASTCPNAGCQVSSFEAERRTQITLASANGAAAFLSAAAVSQSDVVSGRRFDRIRPSRIPVRPGKTIQLPPEEFKRYAEDHVIVQITGFGTSELRSGRKPRHNFIEEIGGVIELIPAKLLDKQGELGFSFQVSNPGERVRTIYLHVDVHAPPGFEAPPIFIDTEPRKYKPGETRVFEGVTGKGGGDSRGGKKPHEGPWSLSLHTGRNDPQGSFGTLLDGGLSAALDLEYAINALWAIELYAGYDELDGEGFDVEVLHLNLNAKRYFLPGPNRFFALAGIGTFDLDPGPSEFGWNVGAGGQWNLWPNTALEAAARRYEISTSPTFELLTYQIGLRLHF